MGLAASALLAFFITLLVMPPLLRTLDRLGSVDVPNHRSSHETVVLRGAGLAITLGFGVGLASSRYASYASYASIGLLILTFLLTVVGFIDDRRSISAAPRLAALLIAGACLGAIIPAPFSVVFSCALAALWIASVVNAYNFMDGINGISALTAMVSGASFVVLGVTQSNGLLGAIGACAFGASAAFLPFNAPRARAFMGDAGSYGLGFILGAGAWTAWVSAVPIWVVLAPLSIYLIDTASTLGLRAWQRKPLSEAHRDHVYQRLVQRGWTHIHVSLFVAGCSATIFAVTFATWRRDMPLLALAVWLAAALSYGVGARLLLTNRHASVQPD